MTMAEGKSNIRLIKDIPYLALTGEQLFSKDFGENWPCYNGTALYFSWPTVVH